MCCWAQRGRLIVPVTIQMISRNTGLIPAWIWTEEMARFLFIWMVMLGAMIGVRDGSHFECDVWPELKPRANALLHIVSMVFVLVFALVFVWYGTKFVQFGWNQTSELADMPMTYIFISWPLTGLTWLLFGFERLRIPARRHRRPGPVATPRIGDRHGERGMSPPETRCARLPPRGQRGLGAAGGRVSRPSVQMTGATLTPTIAALWLFGGFFFFLVLRAPVAFALGLACLPVLFIEPRLSPMVEFNTMFKAYNSFILLAVPFFLLTANLMNVGASPIAWSRCRERWSATSPARWRRSTCCCRCSSPAFPVPRRPTQRARARSSSRRRSRKATTFRSRSRSPRCRRCWR
jgi:TRAP-type C4-dicarboxylate transport system permease small subunit